MKKYIGIFVVLILLLTGCGNSTGGKKESTGEKHVDGVVFSKIVDNNNIHNVVISDLDGKEIKRLEMGEENFTFANLATKGYVAIQTLPEDLSEEGKFGIINSEGVVTIEPTFSAVTTIGEGFSIAIKEDALTADGNNLYSVINTKGELIADSKYSVVGDFKDGHAVVGLDNKFGIINGKGEEVVPMEYVLISVGNDGIYSATKSGQNTEFIDATGKKVLDNPYNVAQAFNEGLVAIKKDANSKVGFMDKDGNLAIDFIYDDVLPFVGDLAPVLVDTKWGLVNKKGEIVVEPQYDGMQSVKEDFISFGVKQNDVFDTVLAGIFNSKGEVAFEATFEKTPTSINEGMAMSSDEFGIYFTMLNPETKERLFEGEITYATNFKDGFSTINLKDGSIKVVDKNGKEAFDSSGFNYIGVYVDGIASAQKDYKNGFVDKKGKFTEFKLKKDIVIETSPYVPL